MLLSTIYRNMAMRPLEHKKWKTANTVEQDMPFILQKQ